MNFNFRTLNKEEIELRVQSATEKGAILLCYQDARVAMNLLDEVVGPMNWQNDYELIDGQLFCKISIYDEEKGQWITKMDVGTESKTEEVKGRASDAFKRASVRFGIGRELYAAPFIWVSSDKCKIVKGKNGNLTTYDRFVVSGIGYDDKRRISYLQIKNQKTGAVVYEYGTEMISSKTLNALRDQLSKSHVPWEWAAKACKVKSLECLTEKQAIAVLNNFQKLLIKWAEQKKEAQEQLNRMRENENLDKVFV